MELEISLTLKPCSFHEMHAGFTKGWGLRGFLSVNPDLIRDECWWVWRRWKRVGRGWSFPESKVEVMEGKIHRLFFFLFFSDSLVGTKKKKMIKLLQPTVCSNLKEIVKYGKSQITIRLEHLQAPSLSLYSISQRVDLDLLPRRVWRTW